MSSRVRIAETMFTPAFNLPGAAERAQRAVLARKIRPMSTDGRGHPATSEMDYSNAEAEFMMAVESWKVRTGRRFPTLCEILRIAREIGYTRNVEPFDMTETQEFDTALVAQAVEDAETMGRKKADGYSRFLLAVNAAKKKKGRAVMGDGTA